MAGPWEKYGQPKSQAPWAKYAQAAPSEPDKPNRLIAALQQFAHGATMGTIDEMAGGVGYLAGNGYEASRDRARADLARNREAYPWQSMGAEVAGAIPTAIATGPLAMGARTGVGAAVRGGALGAAEGALYGGATAEGGLQDRLAGAGRGAAVGAGLGAAAVPATAAVLGAWNAVMSPALGAVGLGNTTRANRALARTMSRSGQTADDLGMELTLAAREGQPEYLLADALGNPGQRMLAGVARQPGDYRGPLVEALESRQGSQGRRLSGFVAEALGTPDTAAQRAAALTSARGDAADIAYAAARGNAAPVDIRNAVQAIDDRIGPMQGSGVSGDGIDAKLAQFRGRLIATDANGTTRELSDFNRVLGVKQDVQDARMAAKAANRGNEARELKKLEDELDAALEQASLAYRSANDEFARASRTINTIETGRGAASPRSRVADNLQTYGGLTPEQQAAFRSGYADPMLAKIEGAAPGVNKARPLTADDVQAELGAMARDPALLQRQIGRESTMFETRRQATGGSQTADNLADMADSNAAGGVFDAAMAIGTGAGGAGGAVRSAMRAISPMLTGNNEATRRLIAQALMSRDPAAAIAKIDNQAVRDAIRSMWMQAAARSAGRPLLDGIGAGPRQPLRIEINRP